MQVNDIDAGSFNMAQQRAQMNKNVEQAEGFAEELSKAQQNTLDDPAYQKKLREACQGFESMFIKMMWKEMRNTVHENPLFGESQGEKIFRDMLDTELADRMSESGGLGLADVMYDQLTLQYQAGKDAEARAKAKLAAMGRKVDLEG